jgi:hypothetical protein
MQTNTTWEDKNLHTVAWEVGQHGYADYTDILRACARVHFQQSPQLLVRPQSQGNNAP